MRAEQDRERMKWQRTAFLSAHIINYACFREPPKKHVDPQDVLPHVFTDRDRASTGVMTKERLKANYQRHYERIERERERKQARGEPT